nr:MAG TPA: hypothetical protein [Caudoviricetes sp.]
MRTGYFTHINSPLLTNIYNNLFVCKLQYSFIYFKNKFVKNK